MRAIKLLVIPALVLGVFLPLFSYVSAAESSCDIDSFLQQIERVRNYPQSDMDIRLKMLEAVASGVTDCLRISKRSPELTVYAAEQQLTTRVIALKSSMWEKEESIRNMTEVMAAVASTTKALDENKNQRHAVTDVFWTSGGVVMNLLIVNPIDSLDTGIDLRVPLPKDFMREYLVNKPDELELEYDPVQRVYVLVGTVSVARGDMANIALQFEDVWSIPEYKLAAIRDKAADLYRPLVGSYYAAAALALSEKIERDVDSIRTKQEGAVTPEEKVAMEEENNLAFSRTEASLAKLRALAAKHNRDVFVSAVMGVGVIFVTLLMFYRLRRPPLDLAEVSRS